MKARTRVRRGIRLAAVTAGALAVAAGSVTAAPATDSWAGRCSVSGTLKFADAIGGKPTFTRWRERGSGTCTGALNGVAVADSPITVKGRGSGTLSCLVSGIDVRLTNTVTFTHGTRRRGDDVAIGFSGRSVTALGESVALMHGDVSGEAIAHVDFLTGSGIAAADRCARNSLTSMGFRATTRTLSTMRG